MIKMLVAQKPYDTVRSVTTFSQRLRLILYFRLL